LAINLAAKPLEVPEVQGHRPTRVVSDNIAETV